MVGVGWEEVLVTCSVLPLTPPESSPSADHWAPQTPDVIPSATRGRPSLIPRAQDQGFIMPLSRRGAKINFNQDWRAVMQLPGLGQGQRGELEGRET